MNEAHRQTRTQLGRERETEEYSTTNKHYISVNHPQTSCLPYIPFLVDGNRTCIIHLPSQRTSAVASPMGYHSMQGLLSPHVTRPPTHMSTANIQCAHTAPIFSGFRRHRQKHPKTLEVRQRALSLALHAVCCLRSGGRCLTRTLHALLRALGGPRCTDDNDVIAREVPCGCPRVFFSLLSDFGSCHFGASGVVCTCRDV
jgi:hypothetical protein